ncbi:MAG: 6-phosphofructokinase [Phycisphaerales bacterium]|nr:6-phosphofructokinase [Phycisphaerales bacterium]
MSNRRIGILTGGGDCPGLNAVIRAVVKTATTQYNMEVLGFHDSYRGILEEKITQLSYDAVSGILTRGGTILGTNNKDRLFGVSYGHGDTDADNPELQKARAVLQRHHIEGIIVIGGDGTLTVASHLQAAGIPIVGIPKTIDNDVQYTETTVGFDTAVTIATEAIDRLHSTAESHHRAMVVEVMGRTAGWIALTSGIAGGGDVILLPEMPYSLDEICRCVKHRHASGRRFSIIVAAEGAHEPGGTAVTSSSNSAAHPTRLGGIGALLASQIEEATGIESRATVLGHLLRGGAPTWEDRLLGTLYGQHAAALAAAEKWGKVVVLQNQTVSEAPLSQIANAPRRVELNHPYVKIAQAVGMSFGVRS